jgi:hypothetical protein
MNELVGEISKAALTQRATAACLELLEPQDRACFITFNNETCVYPWQNTDAKGKQTLRSSLEAIRNVSSTHITAALRAADDVMTHVPSGRRGVVFFLTDGRPEGEQDVDPDLYLASRSTRFPVHIVGFGYATNASLLHKMSAAANSPLAFISDASMAATTMANIVAHAIEAQIFNLKLVVKPSNGFELTGDTWTADQEVACGYIVAGQKRSFKVDLVSRGHLVGPVGPAPLALLQVFATYDTAVERKEMFFTAKSRLAGDDVGFVLADARQKFVAALSDLLNEVQDRSKFDLFLKTVFAQEPQLVLMIEECRDQVTLALTVDAWAKWGKSYVSAMLRAHELEYPLNFKDLSTRFYATPKVSRMVNETLDIFKTKALATKSPVKVNWERLANANTGCVSGACRVQVKISNGEVEERCLDELVKGDQLVPCGRVVCLVRSRPKKMVRVGQLFLTAYHPIQSPDGRWVFPADVTHESEFEFSDSDHPWDAYSFVLEGATHMVIEDVPVIALGHGINDIDEAEQIVASHPYFSAAVLDDIKSAPGFEDGLVDLKGVERDPETDLVCKFVF